MAWAGTGVIWALVGGVPKSYALSSLATMTPAQKSESSSRRSATATSASARRRTRMSPRRCSCGRPAQRDAAAPGVRAAHRRHQPALEGERVRHGRSGDQGDQDRSRLLRAGRARRAHRQRRAVSRALRKQIARRATTASITAACTSSALVNVMDLKAGGLGSLGAEQLDWLKRDVQPAQEQHADRRVRAHPDLGGLSAVGLGHRRQRAGARVAQALRIGDRA